MCPSTMTHGQISYFVESVWTPVVSSGLCGDWKQPDGDPEGPKGFCHLEEQWEGHRHVTSQVFLLAGQFLFFYILVLFTSAWVILCVRNCAVLEQASSCWLLDLWRGDDSVRAFWGHREKPNVWFLRGEECTDIQLRCNQRGKNLHNPR